MTHYLDNFPVADGVSIVELTHDGAKEYNKQELDQRINKIAAGLVNLQLPPNSPISILDFCTIDYVTTAVAIYRSRHSMVAINHKIPSERVQYCFKDAGPKLVFCCKELRHLVPDDIKCIVFGTEEFESFMRDEPYTIPPVDYSYVNNIMYTSGTTGDPKGVVTTYGARMLHQGKYRKEPVPQVYDRSVSICASPLYHLAGLNNVERELFSTQCVETCLILMPVFDAKQYIPLIEEYKVTHIKLVSPMMSMILQETEILDKTDLSSVVHVMLTSSAAPKKLQEDIKKYFKNVTEILNPYGLTETGPLFGLHPNGIPKPITSVGYPLPTVSVRINKHGVLEVKSPAMLARYHNKDTSASMTSDGYFITGDLFKVNKYGFYFYVGRADDMFKSGGEKIYPSEIEAIIDRHPAVAISTVVGVPDDIKGFKPYAFVQLQPGAVATPEEIKEFTIKNVATYQIPREVWIVDTIPKTNIGKIDRRALTNLATEIVNK